MNQRCSCLLRLLMPISAYSWLFRDMPKGRVEAEQAQWWPPLGCTPLSHVDKEMDGTIDLAVSHAKQPELKLLSLAR